MAADKYLELPCPICGGRSYAWGHLHANGMTFIADDASLLGKLLRYSTKLPARRCNDCGNVQVFSKPPGKPSPDVDPDF